MTDASGTISGNNGTGNTYAYHSNMQSTFATNRDIPNVRVATSFTRRDGSRAVAGEPLVKRRFPLSQLALLSVVSPTPAQQALIQQYFGLVLDTILSTTATSVWDYDNPNGTSRATAIMTLGQVAALTGSSAREPDFFELLKAAILSGSLGLNPGPPVKPGVYGDVNGISLMSDAQIWKIGANIIDQYRTGNYPINIYANCFTSANTTSTPSLPCTGFDAYNHFYGIKNLPYLTRVVPLATLDPPAPATATGYNCWYIPEFYYPHQIPAASPGPSAYCIQAWGCESEIEETYTAGGTYFGPPVDYGMGSAGPAWRNSHRTDSCHPPQP